MLKSKIRENKTLFTAAVILLIYGIVEVGDCIYAFLITLELLQGPEFTLRFVFPAIQELWTEQPIYMLFIFLAFSSLRITSALGLLRNRLWGWWLALIASVLTLGVMFFFLPFGALDGIITVPVLILLLIGYFGPKAVIE